ncbi:NAD(P)/FAD-dependent oxidoreductase [Chitinophaga pinensis]|nr:tryptophan 7-halogenase [Chitinophaga pinensis]
MTPEQTFDVLIIGAGPAGTCAALRLLSLGYNVALAESESFPRPQIGESLSPGVRNIFDYLQAGDLLNTDTYLHQLNAQVIWDTPTPQIISTAQRGSGVMADRAQLDQDLLQLAINRGLQLYQPARLNPVKEQQRNGQRISERTRASSVSVPALYWMPAAVAVIICRTGY